MEWDEAKRQSNIDRHHLDFVDVIYFDMATATHRLDRRREYGEERLVQRGSCMGVYACSAGLFGTDSYASSHSGRPMTANRKPIPTLGDDLPPLTDEAGEVRELTAEDFKHFKPTSDFPELLEAFERGRGQRGPQKAPVKERVGLRLDAAVVEHFRATGPGWQSRINDILADYVKHAGK